jgi:hypothetical protein
MIDPKQITRLVFVKKKSLEMALASQASAERAQREAERAVAIAQDHVSSIVATLTTADRIDIHDLEQGHARVTVAQRQVQHAHQTAALAEAKAQEHAVVSAKKAREADQMERWQEIAAEQAQALSAQRERTTEDELAAMRASKPR